jgi:hypothetical protein
MSRAGVGGRGLEQWRPLRANHRGGRGAVSGPDKFVQSPRLRTGQDSAIYSLTEPVTLPLRLC